MKIWLVDLESVETRYTSEWKIHVPKILRKADLWNETELEVVDGSEDIPDATTPGAFLNFGGTNIYKSTQVEKISRAFTNGKIKSGDHIVFTDAWHPGVINIKYMSELLQIPVVMHGLWHAGSYDPADFLGRLVGNKPWCREKYVRYDHNYYASTFHDCSQRTFRLFEEEK